MWVPPVVIPPDDKASKELEKFGCPECKLPFRNTPDNHNLEFDKHVPCTLCRFFFCIECGIDRRHPAHPSYCQPGEW